MRSHASTRVSSQYGCCSRVNLGVALSTCTCARAVTDPACAARRTSVNVSRFIASIYHSFLEPGIRIHPAIAQKRPVGTRLAHPAPVNICENDFFLISRDLG